MAHKKGTYSTRIIKISENLYFDLPKNNIEDFNMDRFLEIFKLFGKK